jgi:hypothetical protein
MHAVAVAIPSASVFQAAPQEAFEWKQAPPQIFD